MRIFLHTTLSTLLVCITLGSACINGQNFGPSIKENRKVKSFDEIEVSHGIDVFLTMGSEELLEVEAPEGLLKDLKTEVKGDKLKIYYDRSFSWNNETKIYLQARRVKKINVSGGSDLKGEDLLDSDNLELNASGGSDIHLDVSVGDLEVEVSGGSDIVLSGDAVFIKAETSGGSDLKAFDLTVGRAELDASGGSDIKITVEDELKAKASGGADIDYKGNPNVIETDASSSGDIKKVD